MVTETLPTLDGTCPTFDLAAMLQVAGVDPTEFLGADDAAVLAVAPVKVATQPTPPAPAGVPEAFEVPAGVTVFAVTEADAARKVIWGRCLKADAARKVIWGRCLKADRTTRVNRFTRADLVEVLPTGYVFRLPSNRRGLALLMVPAEHVRAAA